MQKFENGQEVEVKGISGVSKYMSEGIYEGKSVIATCTGKLLHVITTHIHPVQLICDEAREYIKANRDSGIEFIADSVEIKRELQEFLFSLGFEWYEGEGIRYLNEDKYCVRGSQRLLMFDCISEYPKLNLKTGEVIPFVDLRTRENVVVEDNGTAGPVVHTKPFPSFEDLKDTSEEKVLIGSKEGDAEKRKERLLQMNIHIDDLNGLIKEKDAEIVELKNTINSMSDDIKCAVDNITDWIK